VAWPVCSRKTKAEQVGKNILFLISLLQLDASTSLLSRGCEALGFLLGALEVRILLVYVWTGQAQSGIQRR